MRLSDIKKLVEAAGVPCFKWVVPDPEDVPIPHACVAKISNGDNLYADNGNYFPAMLANIEFLFHFSFSPFNN